MKLIRCFTRSLNLQKIRQKLFDIGAPGMSVTNGHGVGKALADSTAAQKGLALPQLHEFICVEVAAEPNQIEPIIEALIEICRTGTYGDGAIFVLPVDRAIRIRTGCEGVKAFYQTK